MNNIKDNIRMLKENIADVCIRSGRKAEEIKLIAVSKTIGVDKIRQAIDAGLDTFGENYVQEAREKINALPSSVHWHFIGNIQGNKVKYLIKTFELIHSVGSKEIAENINKKAMQTGIVQPVLFEINMGEERTKSGFAPGEFMNAISYLRTLKNILPSGLMTMPPPVDDETQLSRYFAMLADMRSALIKQHAFGSAFKELSMGMSSDYKVAVKEGATMIRIGTAIFGSRRR